MCGISDDAATCYKLGLLPDRIGVQAERMADWCWFASTLVGLVEVGVEDGIISSAIRDSMSYALPILHFVFLSTCSRKPSLRREYGWTRSGFGVWPSHRRARARQTPKSTLLAADITSQTAHGFDIRLCVILSSSIGDEVLLPPPAYDVFHLKRWRDSAKGFSGLASAVLRYTASLTFFAALC